MATSMGAVAPNAYLGPPVDTVGTVAMGPAQMAGGRPVDIANPEFYERIYQPLYDHQLVTAADTETLFFNAAPASIRVGNVTTPHQLPRHQQFRGAAIGIHFINTATATDMADLANSGVLRMRINSMDYYTAPIYQQGGVGDLWNPGASAPSLGPPVNSLVMAWPIPFIFQELEQFFISIQWVTAIAPVNPVEVGVWLFGVLYRKPVGS